MKKFLIGVAAMLLSAAALAAGIPTHSCYNIDSSSDYLAQATNGQMSLNGQICTDLNATTYQVSDVSWNGTLTFHNFAPPNAPGFNANGALTFSLDDNIATGALNVNYNGTLVYTYQGATYNVTFNNLTVALNVGANGISASTVTGSVTLNGTTYPAGTWVWGYLF